MNSTEWIAAALGVTNVALVVRRSIWNYPFAVAMVSLYFFVFLDAKLYSDALLQIFFLAINLYGWLNWLRSRRETGKVVVSVLTPRQRLIWGTATLAVSLAWGLAMARFTDAAAPLIDAIVAGGSIAAQLLLSLRRLENWELWIAVDLIAIPLYLGRGLYPTAALYAVFLALSVAGLLAWQRTLKQQREEGIAA